MSIRIPSTHHLPPIYGNKQKCKFYIVLGFYYVLHRVVKIFLRIKDSQNLNHITQTLNIRISHIKSILTQQKLPDQLRKYLVTGTRNLPSLKTYLRGDINHACRNIFTEFNKLLSARKIYTNEYDGKKIKEDIEDDLNALNRNISYTNKSDLLSGVCHAMTSQIATKYLSGSNPSLASYTYEYSKGVDVDTAGLQLFLDAQSTRHFKWEPLQSIAGLLGMAATTTNANHFDLSRNGLFHVALPFDYGLKHSLLFNKDPTRSQILDPNFGLFEIPNAQLQDFFKNLYIFYLQQQETSQYVREVSNLWDKTKLFGGLEGFEMRLLERATPEHGWNTYSHKLVWEPDLRSRRS